jgi:hypothetical protein
MMLLVQLLSIQLTLSSHMDHTWAHMGEHGPHVGSKLFEKLY